MSRSQFIGLYMAILYAFLSSSVTVSAWNQGRPVYRTNPAVDHHKDLMERYLIKRNLELADPDPMEPLEPLDDTDANFHGEEEPRLQPLSPHFGSSQMVFKRFHPLQRATRQSATLPLVRLRRAQDKRGPALKVIRL